MNKSSDTDNTELGEILDILNKNGRHLERTKCYTNLMCDYCKDSVRQINALISKAREEEVLTGKINELKDLKNYMISTSPFISEILEPRIEMLENRLIELESNL